MPLLPAEAGYPPACVSDSEPDLVGPLHEALASEFAQLSQQLRQDLRRELRCTLREVLLSGPSGRVGAIPGGNTLENTAHFTRAVGLSGGTTTAVEEHHEWTRRHIRGYLATEYLEFFPEDQAQMQELQQQMQPQQQQQRTPRKEHPSCAEAGNGSAAEHPEACGDGGGTEAGPSPKASDEDPTEGLRRILEAEVPVEQANLPGMPEEARAGAEAQVEGGERLGATLHPSAPGAAAEPPARHNDRLPTTNSTSSRRLKVGGRRAGNFGRHHKALGLVPSRTQFLPVGYEDPTTCRYKVSLLVCNMWFERVALFMNFANAFIIGLESHFMAVRPVDGKHDFFPVSDIFFLVFFALEAMLRLFVYRRRFFIMSGWGWNVFDLILVGTQCFEQTVFRPIITGIGADDLWSTMLIRIINVLRIIKLFRVMGYVPEFRLLVACIVSSLKSFLWSVALLFLLNFCMAIYLLQIIASSKNSGNLDHIGWEELSEWYGNLFIAVYSIFLGLTGGVDWNDLVRPIREYVSFEAAWGLIAFMLFSILALMNVVAGTFVENAIEKAEEVKQHNKVQQARRMFKSLDVDSSGYIGFNELNDHLDDPAVQGYFRAIDVDLSEAKCLFDMLDMNDNGTIDFEEFLSGCVRLQGAARSLDLLMVVRDMRCAFQRMATRFDVLEMNTRIMASAMPSLLRSSSESEPGATV